MEMESTQVADSGAGSGEPDLQAVLDSGASVESILEKATPQTAETPEPASTTEVKEPTTAEPVKTDPDQTTEQDEAEPLPQKIEDLLKQVRASNPKLATDLNKIVREDHFLLHGPTGFLTRFPGGTQEAEQYKAVAPTVEDLNHINDDAQVYNHINRQYESDPAGLVNTLAEEPALFQRVLATLPTVLRDKPQLYETLATPIGQNLFANLTNFVGTDRPITLPDGSEVDPKVAADFLRAVGARYLGGKGQNGDRSPNASRFRDDPEYRELQKLREERAQGSQNQVASFQQSVVKEFHQAGLGEVRKFINEKAPALTDDIKDEIADRVFKQISNGFDAHPVIKSELDGMTRNGRFDDGHRKALFDRLMARMRASLPTSALPEINKWRDRLQKLSLGETENNKRAVVRKDVGAGVQGGQLGDNTDPDKEAKRINWNQVSDEELFAGKRVYKK